MDRVQVITSSRAVRPPLGAVVIGVAVGSTLLIGGLFLAWVALATPVLTGLSPNVVRPTLSQQAVGGAVWAFALVAPPSFAIVGVLRLGRIARAMSAKPRPRAMSRAALELGDEYAVASDVRLPDGRIVRDLVLGPFGLAVINELPSPKVTRHSGFSWEIRGSDGRWAPLENPVERAARDGERVKRWIGTNERDFVVKTYAAVVTTDPSVSRTAGCAVVAPDQIAAWIVSLPPARAMTQDRRADLIDEIRAIA